jgi:hypothetical protein
VSSRVARRTRIGLLALCTALVVLPAGSAAADGGGGRDIIIGPLNMHHGFKVTIDAFSCGQRFQSVSVGYLKAGSGYSIDHYYGGPAKSSSCRAATRLTGGRARARWGRIFNMRMSFGHASGLKRIKDPPDCTGPYGHYRTVEGTGTLKLSIHAKALGRLNLSHVKAMIEEFSTKLNCKPPSVSSSQVTLAGPFISGDLSATLLPSGKRTLFFYAYGHDNPAKGVSGTAEGSFTSRSSSLFSVSSNLSSAKVGSFSPYLTGGMTFTGNSSCTTNSNVENGSLSGTLTLHDPVGKFTLAGPSPYPSELSRGSNYCFG